jgi:hypothetical protein
MAQVADPFTQKAQVHEPVRYDLIAGTVGKVDTNQQREVVMRTTGRTGIGGGESVDPSRMKSVDTHFYSDSAGLIGNVGNVILPRKEPIPTVNPNVNTDGRTGRTIVGDR